MGERSINTQKYPVDHHQREKNWDWYDVGKCDRFTRIEIFHQMTFGSSYLGVPFLNNQITAGKSD